MRQLRVLYVAPDVVVPFVRGASTHVMEVSRGLAALGDCVHVLSRRLERSQPRSEDSEGVHIHRIFRGILSPLPGSYYGEVHGGSEKEGGVLNSVYAAYLSTVFSAYAGGVSADLVKKHGIDVIVERETAFGAGAIAARRSGAPLVLEVVGPRYSPKSAERAKKVLAYTASMAAGIDPSRVVIVDAGVDSARFSPDPQAGESTRVRLGLARGDPVVGYVGTFQPWHGLDLLLEASRSLLDDFPALRLLFVGPYSADVRKLASSMKMADRCVFAGPVPYGSVPDYINACDVMAAPYDPSRSRLRAARGMGSPIKVLEYMACGKPVVTSDIQPTNMIPGVGDASKLVQAGQSAPMAAALKDLLSDAGARKKMGEMGRSLVEKDYSWAAFASRMHEILEKVVLEKA